MAFWTASQKRRNREDREDLVKMFQAFRDGYMSARSKKAKRPWYMRQSAVEARRSLTPAQREAQFDRFIARHGTGSGRGRTPDA